MIVVCDVDSCINNLTIKVIELYNLRANKNIQIKDITSYNFYECLPKEDADGICALFKEKELWDSLSPSYKSQRGLKELLHKGHTVYLATATLPENFPWKVEWIGHHFPFISTDNIICIQNKGLLKCDVLIDDCIDHLASNICERIVIDQPWNQDSTKEYVYDIYRAYDFVDVVNIIDDIERKNEEWKKAVV